MSKHAPTRPQVAIRRFSRGDGVATSTGVRGVVQSASTNGTSFDYLVKPENSEELLLAAQDDLISVPSLNSGKYGGPSRGGAPGGWVGGNNYRARK